MKNIDQRGSNDVIGNPVNMPDFPETLEIRRHAPEPGRHTDEVLADNGYGQAEISKLREEGAI